MKTNLPLFLGLPLGKYFCICITNYETPLSPKMYLYMHVCTFLADTSRLSLYCAITAIRSVDCTTYANFPRTILYPSMYNLLGDSSSTKYK